MSTPSGVRPDRGASSAGVDGVCSNATALNVTVLAGGPGVERDISLQSGQAVAKALERLGHRVAVYDIAPGSLSALDHVADVVFVALHGEFGEDGTVQKELENRNMAFTGSGSIASARAMDKAAAKRRFRIAEIPTPDFDVVDASTARAVVESFSMPVVVKPVSSGSSVDTFVVRHRGEFSEKVEFVLQKYGTALLEKYVEGPELTVAVLGDRALPVCEIRTRRAFYDYQAKYVDDDTEYLFDLSLPARLLSRVQALSLAAHRALGCRVFSRVDWMVDASTQEPYVLEVNTIPGFTTHSLFPKAASKVGLTFERFCQRIVDLSLVGSRRV